MSAPSVTYTFTNSTTSDATQVNQNFTDLVNALSDGTKDLTVSSVTAGATITVSAMASGRVPVTSTGGLFIQDNLYWSASNQRLGIGLGAASPAHTLHVDRAVVGGYLSGTFSNSDNTNAASNARLRVVSGGSSAGDPVISWSNNVVECAMGIDNSVAGDPLVISYSSTLGTTDLMSFTAAGLVTVPGTFTSTGIGTFNAGIVLASAASTHYETGTFTATLTGVTTTIQGTARWVRNGSEVALYLPALTGTSNSTACTITGLPASIQPVRTWQISIPEVEDAGLFYLGSVQLTNASGTITLYRVTSLTGGNSSVFTNTATTKGLSAPCPLVYHIL
jgi:hypothetical protein